MSFILLESNFSLFFGRFHPLVVHLPIGFLLLAAIFQVASRRGKYQALQHAVGPSLFLGAISAVLSAIFGLALAGEGGYEGDALNWHKWLGLGVALVSAVAWLAYTDRINALTKVKTPLLGGLIVLLIITGHLGGNLTHGEGYLLQYAPGFVKSVFGQAEKEGLQNDLSEIDLDSLLVFEHLLQPILEKKCLSCHNDKKQNGDLEMTTKETLLEGGDHGEVLLAGNAMESELFHRVTLNPASKKFMPPKGEVMTFDEIKVLEWWLNSGMSFDTPLAEMEISEDIKAVLLRSFGVDAVKKPYVEKVQVPAVDPSVVEELKQLGFEVTPLAENNHLLEVSARDSIAMPEMEALSKTAEQITWLNFGECGVTDEMLVSISQFRNLTRLRLEKNQEVTDQGITNLANLEHLESLNLYGTAVTDQCLETVRQLPSLKRLYLWQTAVTKEAVDALKNEREDLEIDMGFQFVKLE